MHALVQYFRTLWNTADTFSEFEPVIELYEVDEEYETGWLGFQDQLSLTLEMLLSSQNGPTDRDAVRRQRHVMCSTLENLVKEFVASFFQNSRARGAKPFKAEAPVERAAAEMPPARPTIRAPSLASSATRPSSFASSSNWSSPRAIRPNVASSSSSARQSGISLGAHSWSSISSRQTGSPRIAVMRQPPVPSVVTLPSRPGHAQPAAMEMPASSHFKRRTSPYDDTAGNPRDSAITDMGCPHCVVGLTDQPCLCGSVSYFDFEGYMGGAPNVELPFTDMTEDLLFLGGTSADPGIYGGNSGVWDTGSFPS